MQPVAISTRLRYPRHSPREDLHVIDLIGATAAIAPTAANLGVLLTGLLLGVRHGIDWDHIAAITDITSTTAAAGMADAAHVEQHRTISGHSHAHGGEREIRAHDAGPGGATVAPALAARPVVGRARFLSGQADAIRLGTLYALGHGAVVIALGLVAIAFGALLPAWLDPLMGRIVGVTLVALGLWVLYSIYRYARTGERFRLRSRWMLVFDAMRYGWRRFQARFHGHEHVEPLEMSSYGAKTSFGVGMIHGIGAETGTQVLLIAAVGGASSAGLGVPMLFAFVIGLLLSNFAIVVISSVSFVSSQARERLYVAIGGLAGLFSLVIGSIFLFGLNEHLPNLGAILPF
jgi:high-affinity nickel permease